jgi:error-prone DNA polymerase
MGAGLLLVEGRIQKSPEGIVHVMAYRLVDRSAALRRLSEPELGFNDLLANADEVRKNGPGGSARGSSARHPRNVRILPNSRDFH